MKITKNELIKELELRSRICKRCNGIHELRISARYCKAPIINPTHHKIKGNR